MERIYDVGVSGIHRLFDKIDIIQSANCVVAVAGMEGALASVLGGLVDKPCARGSYFCRLWGEYEWPVRTADDDQFLCQRNRRK